MPELVIITLGLFPQCNPVLFTVTPTRHREQNASEKRPSPGSPPLFLQGHAAGKSEHFESGTCSFHFGSDAKGLQLSSGFSMKQYNIENDDN